MKKKIMFVVVAAIIVMATITGCSNATTTKNANSSTTATTTTIPTTTTGTTTETTNSITNQNTNSVASAEQDSYTTSCETSDDEESSMDYIPENDETETDTTTEEEDILDYYFNTFNSEKSLLERNRQTLKERGQYESFEARDLSKYGIWEYEPWCWTDHYGKYYKWPVLVNEGEKNECLLIESDDGDLIRFTCWADMLKKQNLGSLYE